jgi:ankyrin repeat protein
MKSSQRCFELLEAGDADGLQGLLASDPGAAETRDASGVSLVMHALYRGRRDIAVIFAGKKNELDIFEAASLGRLERLSECLKDVSALNTNSSDGFTALHFACYFGQPESARLLLEKGAAVDAVAGNATRVMPLHSAASARNLEGARLLLENGAPVNARQRSGWAPIHAAAQNGDRAMVKLLLKHGADAQASNDDGKTAASLAREKGHPDILALVEG